MRRRRNWLVWAGFGVALLAVFSYVPVFSRFPVTRDFPWVNLLLFLAAGGLLVAGLYRAFAEEAKYRGKITGVVLSGLSLALFGFFSYGVFYMVRDLPSVESALRVGQRAPEFALAGIDGKPVTLSQLRQGKRAVLVIFYRGYW